MTWLPSHLHSGGAGRTDASLVAEKLKLEFQKLELQKQEMEFKKLQWEKSEATEKSKTQFLKLPKLEFMKFNGMVLKWPEFYGAFEAAVDSNSNLSVWTSLITYIVDLREMPWKSLGV